MVASPKIFGQPDSLRFEHLSVKQGLSHNKIFCILQDREGFLWFGTRDGLNKYDGYNFTVYQPDPANPTHHLRHNWIKDIYEDKAGTLWVATLGGLHKVDKRSGTFTYYSADTVAGGFRNGCYAIFEDHDGSLLITTEGGINRFDPETETFSFYPPPTPDNRFMYSIVEDQAGILWIGTLQGLFQLDLPTGQYTRFVLDSTRADQTDIISSVYHDISGTLWVASKGVGLYRLEPGSRKVTLYPELADCYIYSMGLWEDEKETLWIGTNKGLKLLNKKTGSLVTFRANHAVSGSLSNDVVRTIYQDRSGTLWVGTVNGIDKLPGQLKKFRTYQVTPDVSFSQLPENFINAICEDRQGIIWLGTYFNGLYRYDRQTGTYTNYQSDPADESSLMTNQIDEIYEDSHGILWIGTAKGLHAMDRKTGQFTRYPTKIFIFTIAEDTRGNIWIGGNGIASFDRRTGQFTYIKNLPNHADGEKIRTIIKILTSRTGDLWLASTSQFLRKLNPMTGESFSFRHSLKDTLGVLNDNDIRSLYEDNEGVLWVGTNQGGLNRLDPNTNTFTAFTKHDGLPSNHIAGILSDKKGNLWLSTHKGICRFNPKTKSYRNYDQSEGLQDNEFHDVYAMSKKGELLFGGPNGFNIIHPDSIEYNWQLPPLHITSFSVLNEPRPFDSEVIELSHRENFISFDFVALNFHNSRKNRYAYQLKGLDQDWVYSGTRRFANYTDLKPGHYTFRVKGANNDGVWNEQGASINIIISPPWWQTWWAKILYALAAGLVLYALRYYTVSRERLNADLKLKSIESEKLLEMDHLKSHFFANISHEFRTPLTLILGPLEKLLSTNENSSLRETYQTMYRNTQRLLTLINQLLDLSKLEAGKMKLEPSPTNLIQYLKRIVFSFTSLAESKKVLFRFQYPNDNPVVYLDADKLEKILTNLIANAFKFTPEEGQITVSASLKSADDPLLPEPLQNAKLSSRHNVLQLLVQDDGLGIPEDQVQKIFNRFYQADNSQTREQGGTGIGLSLVQELVELHQGHISIQSQVGKGSCFTVYLPLLIADYHEIVVTENPVEPSKAIFPADSIKEHNHHQQVFTDSMKASTYTKNPLVLIVEDNAEIRFYIRENLEPYYKVMEAADGAEGYGIAQETIPDLIISDVMMPKMDGVELCRKLKLDEKTSHIPVILLTAKASGDNKIAGLETGADDYIIKPFEARELLARGRNLIDTRRKLRERFTKQISLQPAAIAITSVDEKFLQRAMQLMEEHMSDPDFGVETFGREVGMSRTQLFRKLKALTNQSPGDFIRIMRLKRAAELLEKGAGTIAEVAFQTGFQDPSYFTKCFQKQFGQTPSEFLSSTI